MIEAGCQTHVPATIIKQIEDWKPKVHYKGLFLINFTNRIEPGLE